MSKYEIPETSEAREKDLTDNIEKFKEELSIFREKGKKAACSRARNALNIIKKLITAIKRDLASESDNLKKVKTSKDNSVQEEVQGSQEETKEETQEETQEETLIEEPKNNEGIQEEVSDNSQEGEQKKQENGQGEIQENS